MKYNILSIGAPEREHYRQDLRKFVPFDEVDIPAVDGRMVKFKDEYEKRGLFPTSWTPKTGEAGVWLSNFDRWQWVSEQDDNLIVFEDDAVVYEHFADRFDNFYYELPDDWDFAALWVPENQRIDYRYNCTYDENGDPVSAGPIREYPDSQFKHSFFAARVYQGYGMVSLMYSPQGGRKLVDLARKTGIAGPVDCWIYQHNNLGDLNGYAPTPIFAKIVHYNWDAETTVQKTQRVEL